MLFLLKFLVVGMTFFLSAKDPVFCVQLQNIWKSA